MIAQFPEILQRLEDMLLFPFLWFGGLDSVLGVVESLRLGEVVIEVLLHLGQFAIVILNDLGR